MRADPTISGYAERVRSLLASESSVETQRELVRAMREALQFSETAKRVDTIFEVESWICKALHYVPKIGPIFSVVEIGLELGRKWIERKKKQSEWFLLGPKMTEVSLKDYLKRTGNL